MATTGLLTSREHHDPVRVAVDHAHAFRTCAVDRQVHSRLVGSGEAGWGVDDVSGKVDRNDVPLSTSKLPVVLECSGMDTREVTEHLLQRARWTASRSSGPGGQRRDKVETRAELTVDAESLEGLDPALAARLAERLGLQERPLRITNQDERSLTRNQESAAERLAELVAEALAPPPPRRRATRPSRRQREARLSEKGVRSSVKRLRQRPANAE